MSSSAHTPREWDATTYDALPLPHDAWSAALLSRLPLRGNETVLEAGSGTGRDAVRILERLPTGHLIAVDGSATMLNTLRAKVGGDPRVTVLQADLREELPVPDASVDAVASVATLHWLPDHRTVFTHLARVLRPGGLLRVECGGQGQLARVEAALFAAGYEPLSTSTNFAGIEQTREALADAGFTEIDVRLVPSPATLPDEPTLQRYLATIVLGAHLQGLGEADAAALVVAVAAGLADHTIDYVRLQIAATRAS